MSGLHVLGCRSQAFLANVTAPAQRGATVLQVGCRLIDLAVILQAACACCQHKRAVACYDGRCSSGLVHDMTSFAPAPVHAVYSAAAATIMLAGQLHMRCTHVYTCTVQVSSSCAVQQACRLVARCASTWTNQDMAALRATYNHTTTNTCCCCCCCCCFILLHVTGQLHSRHVSWNLGAH
jgi:hypothetical protein